MASLSEKLTQHGQSHVLHYWNELNGEQKKRLQDQLDQWNLSEVCSTFTESMSELKQKKASPCHNASTLKPLPTDRYLDRSEISSEHLASLKEIGLKAVANGEVAVVLLAGGQGTRLGSTEPKGMYNIGLPSGKSLFQVQVERLIRLQRLAVAVDSNATNRPVHLFVMTSPVTHQDTETYFKQQSYFGLKPEQVHFLQQAVMPCFGLEGELLLADRDRLAESPDGNGGIYSALARSGSLDRMRQLGVKYVHVYCVDNILVRVADPAFVGFAVQRQLAAVAKAVNKRSADEPVGVFGLIDDRLRVLEYSEITCQQSESTDSDGRLTYRLGNICNHLFTLDFLYQVANTRLPQHVALKKIPNLDVKSGDLIQPQSPNGIKLEKFIFDVFELTRYDF